MSIKKDGAKFIPSKILLKKIKKGVDRKFFLGYNTQNFFYNGKVGVKERLIK